MADSPAAGESSVTVLGSWCRRTPSPESSRQRSGTRKSQHETCYNSFQKKGDKKTMHLYLSMIAPFVTSVEMDELTVPIVNTRWELRRCEARSEWTEVCVWGWRCTNVPQRTQNFCRDSLDSRWRVCPLPERGKTRSSVGWRSPSWSPAAEAAPQVNRCILSYCTLVCLWAPNKSCKSLKKVSLTSYL